MKLAYVGADPGLTGAIAIYSPDYNGGLFVHAEDMPVHEVNGKRTVDLWRLDLLLREWKNAFPVKMAFVEQVHAMPDQGVVSSFSFGFSAGALQQAIASAGFPMTLVPAATWKAILGLRGGRANKDASRALASRLFPAFSHLWASKKDDGRAEAVLLAYYGSKLR